MKNCGILMVFVDNKIVAFHEVAFENESDLERLVDEFDHKCTVEFGNGCFVGVCPGFVCGQYVL